MDWLVVAVWLCLGQDQEPGFPETLFLNLLGRLDLLLLQMATLVSSGWT